MKYIPFFLVFIFHVQLSAQSYFSKFYELQNGSRHLPWGLLMEEDGIKVKVGLDSCLDTFSVCTSLIHLDREGEVVNQQYKEFYSKFNENSFIRVEDKLYLFGNTFPFSNRPSLLILDNKLNTIQEVELDLDVDQYAFVAWENLVFRDGYFYASANIRTQTNSRLGLVSKFSLDLQFQRNFFIGSPTIDTFIADLQIDREGNIFAFSTEEWNGVANIYLKFKVIKIDLADEKKELEVARDYKIPDLPSLVVLEENDVVYLKRDQESNSLSSNHVLQRSNFSDTLQNWVFEFPFDEAEGGGFDENIFEIIDYDIYDIAKAKNGDILVCGMAYDSPSSPALGGPYTFEDLLAFELPVYNAGFITRLNSKGELLWQHIYVLPNTYNTTYSDYKFENEGQLLQIEEDMNGDLYAVGRKVTTIRDTLTSIRTKSDSLWVLKTDANGCIDGFDCSDELVLSANKIESISSDSKIEIYPNPVTNTVIIKTEHVLESYHIYDSLGRLLQSGAMLNDEINVSSLANGFLFLTITTKTSQTLSTVIIKN